MKAETDLIGLAPFALLQVDERRRILAANPEAQSLLGYSERIMLRKPLSEIIFHDSEIFNLIDRSVKLDGDVIAHSVSLMGPAFPRQILLDIRLRPTGHGSTILAFMEASRPDLIESAANVATFGRILGHEVKNPLAGISGAAQLLSRKARQDQIGMLDIIQSETKRIERLICRLSAFELFSSPQMHSFNIHALLNKIVAAENMAQASRVTIKCLYDPSLPHIQADQDHLHEALQNIIRNASEAALAGSDHPRVQIKTAFETGFAFAGHTSDGRLARAICISIEDNGSGIPSEKRNRMFDLFTSSKSSGRGLGLNIVSEIISAHHGRINVESAPGQTRFSVYLPIQRKAT